MKFTQLALGARFRYQGEVYCKSSPLAASGPGGAQRMIPRSAAVEPLQDGADAPPPRSPLRLALDAYHSEARQLLEQAADGSPDDLAELVRRLNLAYEQIGRVLDKA